MAPRDAEGFGTTAPPASAAAPAVRGGPALRLRIRVRGLVQGVGFRPFVHSLARRHGMTGWVLNDGDGVLLEVEGCSTGAFLRGLQEQAPPLARIDGIEVRQVPAEGTGDFVIRHSAAGAAVTTAIGPDTALCPDCLAELFDPGDRRFLHPFITCTNCGPRFTIARGLPYDRPLTSMAGFSLCPDCATEYADPGDRRFHAQPLCCHACGPRLDLPPMAILAHLRAGRIVALKGLGGFHLACDAADADAVARLRRAKQRDGKPFALMVANLASARRLVEMSPDEASLLVDRARPIVLLRRRPDAVLPDAIAPGLSELGLLLPYTPLHYLIFHAAAGQPPGTAWLDAPQPLTLVMTSANPGGEPLAIDDAEARTRLAGIADIVVGHDRPILVRADDPVARVVAGKPRLLRRGRGYVPVPIPLVGAGQPEPGPPVLALGAFQKSAICLTRGREAFLSQHIGDLDDGATLAFLRETVAHLTGILRHAPAAIAHDLHPDFPSTRLAEELAGEWGIPTVPVQHHHAHLAAVAAEHGLAGPVVGLALDGYGLGDDGTAWGGELLRLEGADFTRVGHLRPLPQPGGDVAARQPWRMAAAALHLAGRGGEIAPRFAAHGPAASLAALLDKGVRCPPTTSCGRWFDAACGLLGLVPVDGYEGEAPMRLEALVRRPRAVPGLWRVQAGVLDLLPLLLALDVLDPADGADLWHGTLAAALVDWALPRVEGRTVLLSGGCLMNRVLAEALVAGFAVHGVAALLPARAPANDGGLALGQAWVAARCLAAAP